ncbi:MAG: 4a-hydroxytetrahydrobiopterin dehydratase [Bacteroidota bacterium]
MITNNLEDKQMESFVQKQWEEIDRKLYKVMLFKDFQEAFAFMIRVAFLAEKNNHHPKWTNTFNKLEIWLCTHDAGDIVTDKDRSLAKQIDQLLVPCD